MQKVFVILLISLSTCLSKASEPAIAQDAVKPPIQEAQKVPVSPTAIVNNSTTDNKVPDPSIKPSVNVPEKANVTDVPNVHENATQVVPSNQTASKTEPDNKTTDKKEEAAKSDAMKEESHNTTVIPAAKEQTPKSKETPSQQETKSKVEPVLPKNDVTTKPNGTPTTVAPKTDGEKPVLQARGFDGPSFIGGIILTLGLLAIGFMGFKYYKNQTERNYHTL